MFIYENDLWWFKTSPHYTICFFGRRGISYFYNGKSKSFASLSDVTVSCASIKDLGKQENAYTRKRRNLLASKNLSLKLCSSVSRSSGGGISKKSQSNGRNILALAVAMSNSSSSQEYPEQQYQLLLPLHPSVTNLAAGASQVRSPLPKSCSFPLRSFSTTDLQGMTGSGSSVRLKDRHTRFH